MLGQELVGDDDEGFDALFFCFSFVVGSCGSRCGVLIRLEEGKGRQAGKTYHGDGDGVGSRRGWVSDCDAGDGEDDGEDDEDDLRDVDAVFPGFVEGEDGRKQLHLRRRVGGCAFVR